jgi:hypothetical protein
MSIPTPSFIPETVEGAAQELHYEKTMKLNLFKQRRNLDNLLAIYDLVSRSCLLGKVNDL